MAGEVAQPAAATMEPAAPPRPEAALITASELAATLHVGRSTVHELGRSGRLPPGISLGRCRRWRRQEILDWIERGCPPANRWTWRPRP